MKKIIGILAAAALLFAVSSCANDDGVTSVDTAVKGSQDVSAVAAEATAKAAEVTAKKENGSNAGGSEQNGGNANALSGTWEALSYATSTNYVDKTAITDETALGKVYVFGTGAIWRTDSNKTKWTHLELGKAENGCLAFTIDSTSTIVVSAASTGGSNTSDLALINESDSPVKGSASTVTGTSYTEVTYTDVPAGDYLLGAFPATDNGRGVRIKSITVTAK